MTNEFREQLKAGLRAALEKTAELVDHGHPCEGGCGALVVYDAERGGFCGITCQHAHRAPWDEDPDYFRDNDLP